LREKRSFYFLSAVIPAVPALWYLIKTSDTTKSRGWILVAGALFVYLPLALLERRSCRFVSVLLLPCYAYVVSWVMLEVGRRLPGIASVFLQTTVVMLASVIFCSPHVILGYS
jgi:hypothetical protein